MTLPPAGWYTDQAGSGLRWWDGEAWTEHVRSGEPDTSPTSAAVEGAAGTKVIARGMLTPSHLAMKIYADGMFSTGFMTGGKREKAEKLVAFEVETDSMRRKSVAGRSAAAFVTAGISLGARNNRGVIYVSICGEKSGLKTHTIRNPSGLVLSDTRRLKVAADLVLQRSAGRIRD